MTATEPTILATCGGLVGGEWDDSAYGPLLFEAVRLARVPAGRPPRVLHVNTAGGDQRTVEGAELAAARTAGVEASHLRFFPRRNVPSLRDAVLGADVVWVSGGSVVNLLAVWRAHGLDEVLREAWGAGVVLAGGSAGALCWHTGGVTQSHGPQPSVLADGLGFVSGSLGVHTDSDPDRSPVFRAAVAAGDLPAGIELHEGVGVVHRGRSATFVEAVTDHDGGGAVRIARAPGDPTGIRAEPLPVRRLPDAPRSVPSWTPSAWTPSPEPVDEEAP
ncbi:MULTISPECIES: Type 1 glutamine amidotransferase-like domain-containing protein [unclassified Curtobacterium]|uniref:Type 1 glutamine amidotransferase-like domain-containing protein n=1 Tax=unclassified Curtobacterium TaxID=257496 RepID=UPI0039AEF3D3